MASTDELAENGFKLVGLLHDLLPILYPHLTGHDFSAELEAFLRLPMHLLVATEFTAGDLRRAIAEPEPRRRFAPNCAAGA